MNLFTIVGKNLPDDFVANTVEFDNKKKSKTNDCVNETLSTNDLIEKFKSNTTDGVRIRKVLRKSITTHLNKYKYDEYDMIENYHFFICPVTGCRVLGFDKNHFGRLGVSQQRFLELFPEYANCYTHAPFRTITERTQKMPTEKVESVHETITVNDHTFDMDNYHKCYKVLNKNIKARRKEIPDGEWVLGYSYFECPLTQLPVLQMATKGHLNALGITKDEFESIFPEIDLSITMTPKVRGYTYEQYLNGDHEKVYTNVTEMNEDERESLKHRFMHITDKDEYLATIQDDYYAKQYLLSRRYKSLEIEQVYSSGIEGIDYFICPVFGTKYVKFNSSSLDRYGVTRERLEVWFPEMVFGSSATHNANISKGQQAIDGDTNKTIHQSAVDRATATRRKVNKHGKTTNQIIGEKTKLFDKNNIDEYGRDGYQQHADNTHDQRLIERYGANLKSSTRRERYERIIELITNRCRMVFDHVSQGTIIWGKFTIVNNPPNSKQLDHKYSRHDGYDNSISPLCVAHFNNLDLVDMTANVSKGSTSSITISDLAAMNHMSISAMTNEFELIMNVIDDDLANDRIHNSMNVLIRAGHHIALKMKPYNELRRACHPDEPDTSINIQDILNNM